MAAIFVLAAFPAGGEDEGLPVILTLDLFLPLVLFELNFAGGHRLERFQRTNLAFKFFHIVLLDFQFFL